MPPYESTMRRVLPLGLSRCGGAGGFRTRTNKVHSIECFVRDEVRTEHRSTEVEQPGEESKGGGPQAPSFGRFKGESCQRGFGRLETCLWHVLAQIQSKHSLNQKSKSPLSDRFFGYFLSAQKVTRRRRDQKTKRRENRGRGKRETEKQNPPVTIPPPCGKITSKQAR